MSAPEKSRERRRKLLISPFRDVTMLLRVAAWWLAAYLLAAAVPALAGIETGPGADANRPATSVIVDAPMGQAAVMSDTPRAAPQDPIKAKVDAETEALPTDPITPVETTAPADIPASVQPDVQKPDQATAVAPMKLAALEPVAPNVPGIHPPRDDLRSNLPHIDASFRFNILPVTGGDILTKWNRVEADMRAESEVFAGCRTNMDSCPAAAKDFLAIVDQGRILTGRARIGVINRAVNMSIEPMSDLAQWGVPDKWSAPLETFTTHKGDCEDYAIAKYVALIEAGIAADDVKLMIVHNTAAHEDHAVTAVRLDGAWVILDNRWLRLVEDKAMPDMVPLYALGREGARRYLPDVLIGDRRAAAPASIAKSGFLAQ
jgi:predicted transglutaminase-like cysteine proteinase